MFLPTLPPDHKPSENGHESSTVILGEGYMQRPVELTGNQTNIHSQSRSRILNYATIPSDLSAIVNSFTLDIAVSGLIVGGCLAIASAGAAVLAMCIAAVAGSLFIAAWSQVLDYRGMKPVFLTRLLLIGLGILIVL